MKSNSILLVASALLSLALAACNKPVEETASAKEGNSNVAESGGETQRRLPECSKRNEDGTYKNGHGCSKDEWVEWQNARK